MMSARTSFLVWWGLPILCSGLGASAAVYFGDSGGLGAGGQQIAPIFVIAGYFVAVGALALIFRFRQSQAALGDDRARFDKPVEAAMVAMCAPILAAGLWLLADGFRTYFGPAQAIDGELRLVEQVGAFGRSYAIDLDTTGAPVVLECPLQRDCGSPVRLMQLKPGTKMRIEMLGNRVLGVRADGRQLVDPSAQRLVRQLLGGGALLLLTLYALSFVAVSARLLFGEPQDDAAPAGYGR